MATQQQIQQMLDLMQQQMTNMNTLQEENAQLRAAATTAEANGAPVVNGNVPNNNNNGQSLYRSKKPDRPVINNGIDDREWAFFIHTWTTYKTMINAVDIAFIRNELHAACSEEVRKLLFEFHGPTELDNCTEAELLQHIKSVAVKTVHKEVHRMAFNTMTQIMAKRSPTMSPG